MKVIATLNFKGGVGKTTATWLLARYLADFKNKTVLVVDADPQMSLTTAVNMLDSGDFDYRFRTWIDRATASGSTLLELLKQYASRQDGQLAVSGDILYPIKGTLQLIPSVEELYWYELEAPPAQRMKDFTSAMLKGLQNGPGVPTFDYCLVDCRLPSTHFPSPLYAPPIWY